MLLLGQQGQQRDMGSGPLIFTIERLVVGVLPAKICHVGCLVAFRNRVHVPTPKFSSSPITSKPI